MAKCRYCDADTSTTVWTRGTPRRFVPVCPAARCWKKYWNEFPSQKKRK